MYGEVPHNGTVRLKVTLNKLCLRALIYNYIHERQF